MKKKVVIRSCAQKIVFLNNYIRLRLLLVYSREFGFHQEDGCELLSGSSNVGAGQEQSDLL